MKTILALIFSASLTATAQLGTDYHCEQEAVINDFATIYTPGQTEVLQPPLILKPGPHLLIDDALIASTSNVLRVVSMPQRDPAIPNPIVSGKEDGCFQPYLSVIRADSGEFRLWFGRCTEDFQTNRQTVGYLESEDGIHWERPARALALPGEMQFGVSIINAGPLAARPESRFVFGFHAPEGGLKFGISPDGLSWAWLKDAVVLHHNHDINSIYFDAARGRYIATISVYREGGWWQGKRRITMHSFSTDLEQWTPARYVILPDQERDSGETQFYAMDGYFPRGELLIGMVKVLRDDVKVDTPPDPPDAYGMGHTTLAWSHDGEHWTRDTTPFFSPNPERGAWDHAHAWIDEQVPVGDQVYLYYGGYARGHKVNRFEERQIGLLIMKKDRYAGWQSTAPDGELQTRPLVLQAGALRINADATSGEVLAELQDGEGKPIPEFTFDDCQPVSGDQIDAPLGWAQPLSTLPGKTIRIVFRLDHATLYALYLSE
ncbi:MAG: hypothetical protein HYV26_15900 [Candidatus Hydrogenedentes bacterium]|nr:hypothetical protein [Candidatus Hydrogenedentota bacterium]